MTKSRSKLIAPISTGSEGANEVGREPAEGAPTTRGARLFVTLRAGAVALDRAWNGRHASWNRWAAWTWTIGHPAKAPVTTTELNRKTPAP
jgi:hypothetical protein